MESGLTLTPVINLFFALTPADKPASPPNVLERRPFQKERPSLGDFTRLWNFLGHEPPTRTVTPASPLGLPPPAVFSAKFPPPKSETPNSTSDSGSTTSGTPLSSPYTPTSLPENPLETPRKDTKKVKFSGAKPDAPALPPATPVKQQRQRPKSKEIKVTIDGQEISWEQWPAIEASLPIVARRVILMNKLKKQFPHDYDPLRQTNEPVHVFIDNSNILIGFIDCIKAQRGYKKAERVQRPNFSFYHLTLILERFRPVMRKVLVGSLPHTPVIDEAKRLQYKCDLLKKIDTEAPVDPPKRKRSGSSSSGSDSPSTKNKIRMAKKEQGVDEVLNLKMCESIIDSDVPGTLVLASGDGAIGEFSEGFFKTVERALKKGWKVELVTFSASISRSYTHRAFRRLWNQKFTIIHLDQFAEELLGSGSADSRDSI